jgi:hypothetical protein
MVSARPVTPDVLAVFVEGFDCYNRHDFDAMEAMYAPGRGERLLAGLPRRATASGPQRHPGVLG